MDTKRLSRTEWSWLGGLEVALGGRTSLCPASLPCTVAMSCLPAIVLYCSYVLPPCQVVGLLRELVSHLGPEDRDKVFYSTARDFYKLKL